MKGIPFQPNPNVVEEKCSNGLIKGHAYSVTCVMFCTITSHRYVPYLLKILYVYRSIPQILQFRSSYHVPLIRLRNPWGNEAEWTGKWSDRSPEWKAVSYEEKRRLGLTFDRDGEFWIEFMVILSNSFLNIAFDLFFYPGFCSEFFLIGND